MGETARDRGLERKLPQRELPPCAQAQADGVPCTEVGRKCEICEHATEEWRRRVRNQANGARE